MRRVVAIHAGGWKGRGDRTPDPTLAPRPPWPERGVSEERLADRPAPTGAEVIRSIEEGAVVAYLDGMPAEPGELDGWIGPLWVPGKPQPKGSTRAFMVRGRPIITSDNAALKPWAKAIALAFRAAGGLATPPERMAIVRMRFFVERPKKHFVALDPRRPLRDDVPLFPGRKPDVDKLARGVLDALVGLAYVDDAAVVGIDARKDFACGHGPGVKLWWQYLPGPLFRKGDSGT